MEKYSMIELVAEVLRNSPEDISVEALAAQIVGRILAATAKQREWDDEDRDWESSSCW